MPLRPSAEEAGKSFRGPWQRWLHFVLECVIIGLIAWIAIEMPLPVMDDWLPVKNVLVAGIAVALGGKALYDTLFYDHFWP